MKDYNYSGYRAPHTTQERKANIDDGYHRAKRNNLPDIYDDIPNSSYHTKSWKKRRKNKYHGDKYKKYTLEILYDTYLSVYTIISNIERHLEQLDYSYITKFKRVNKRRSKCIITYTGKHIGNWRGATYK